MNDARTNNKSENENSEPTQETLDTREKEIASKLGCYASFRVGLPSDPEDIMADECRAEVSREILQCLIVLSKKYKGLSMSYNFGYNMDENLPIELIEIE